MADEPTPGQVRAEMARLARRLRSLAKHRKALEQAIAELDGGFDAAAWRAAFKSPDPRLTNQVLAVTGGYSTLLNHYVEIARTSARPTGLMPGRRPNVAQCLDRLREEGALSADEAQMVYELHGVEGRMEHLSPDLSAEEIRDAVVRLRQELPGLTQKTLSWLEGRGFEFG